MDVKISSHSIHVHPRPFPVDDPTCGQAMLHPTKRLTISRTGSTALVCWMLGPATHTVL